MHKWILACTTVALAATLTFTPSPARAQDHGHHRDGHMRFDDHDRGASRDWYRNHHDHLPVGFRDQDRLSPELESRLRVGAVLDPDLRHRIHPVPPELLRLYPPPPRHYRYVVIGGHVCLIDAGFHVADVIHFELNL